MATVRLTTVRVTPKPQTTTFKFSPSSKSLQLPSARTTNLQSVTKPHNFFPQRAAFHTSRSLRQQQANEAQNSTEQQPKQEQPKQEQNQQPELEATKIIEDLRKQMGDIKTSLAYAVADLENYKKISKRDIENAHSYGITNFAKDLLDVADNFGRCLASVPKEQRETNDAVRVLYEGVEMTSKVLNKAFEKHGLVRFDPLGEKFDPHKMNAVYHFPDPNKTPGTVSNVMKAGYILKDRVIRAADVGVVAQGQQQQQQQEQPKQ